MLTVTDLTTLDPSEVEQFRQSETAMVQAYNPTADLKRGPTQDLVITIKAALDAATQENIDLVRQSSSLLEVSANPALGDADTVNRLLSNYGLTRKPAAAAAGTVAVIHTDLVPVIITPSVLFTVNGQQYQTTTTIAGRTSAAAVVGPGDVLIVPVGPNWGLPVPVVAITPGAAGNARSGSAATLSQPPPKFLRAYAAGDIAGGADAETNAQLLARLQSGLAFKAWGNRGTVDATLREQFPELLADSIIGFGDAEMLRDAHSLWPGHTGGRVDVYVRTSPSWVTVTLGVTATLVSVSGTQGTWQAVLGRDQAAGTYEVERLLLPGSDPTAAGFPPTADVRGLDLRADDTHTYFPDLVTPAEGAYSRYQTVTVTFVDTVTNVAAQPPGTQAAYTAVLRTMPSVDAIQDYLGGREVRPPMSDVLARAAVPCYTGVSMTLNIRAGTPVSVSDVQAAVAAAVNGLGFAGSVAASFISQVVHDLVGPGLVSITGFGLTGRLRRPDGAIVYLSGTASLDAPNDPGHMVSARTVAFLLDAQDVAVTVLPVATS